VVIVKHPALGALTDCIILDNPDFVKRIIPCAWDRVFAKPLLPGKRGFAKLL
jgi:hypothetical protein